MTRFAIDTNILVYAEGLGEPDKVEICLELVQKLPIASTVIPVQVLGELTRVLHAKARRPYQDIKTSIAAWSDSFTTVDTTQNAFSLALELASSHDISIWDAIIMAVARENRCQILLSEDMQDGFHWAGLTIINPFKDNIFLKYKLSK